MGASQEIATRHDLGGRVQEGCKVQADWQDGRRKAKPAADAGLSAAEREELSRLRRENKQLRLERDILSRATAWFARETGVIPSGSSGS